MNTLESCSMTSPNNKTEDCAKFTIDDTSQVFALPEVMVIGREYTFSCWVRSDEAGSIIVGDATFSSITEWTYVKHTFIADQTDLYIAFTTAGAYYIYHAQLELGNKATDWIAAPEDTDASIASADSTANDAKNKAESNEKSVSEAKENIDNLRTDVDALTPMTNYVHIELDEAVEDAPYIELGKKDSEFKLKITNQEIQFMQGSFKAAYINNEKLHIPVAVIEDELQVGGFIWEERDNGNVGLLWKGGS